jgi:hypothetical protein
VTHPEVINSTATQSADRRWRYFIASSLIHVQLSSLPARLLGFAWEYPYEKQLLRL